MRLLVDYRDGLVGKRARIERRLRWNCHALGIREDMRVLARAHECFTRRWCGPRRREPHPLSASISRRVLLPSRCRIGLGATADAQESSATLRIVGAQLKR